MADAAIPVNQINAMPAQTVSALVNGSMVAVGDKVVRYFSPGDLFTGTVGTFPPLGSPATNGYIWYLATPFLNLLGCTRLQFELAQIAGSHLAAPSPQPITMLQARTDAVDVPAVGFIDGAGAIPPINFNVLGMVQLDGVPTFATSPSVGAVQRALIVTGGTNSGSYGQEVAMGTDFRIVVMFGNGAAFNNPGDNNVYTAAAWAC